MTAIRPFNVNVPESELTELRRRINATKWPERETVADATQGVQLATIQALASYWAKEYDWRKIEAKLNERPQFITEIDGLDIHFIHVRSKHEYALPLSVTVCEQMGQRIRIGRHDDESGRCRFNSPLRHSGSCPRTALSTDASVHVGI